MISEVEDLVLAWVCGSSRVDGFHRGGGVLSGEDVAGGQSVFVSVTVVAYLLRKSVGVVGA